MSQWLNVQFSRFRDSLLILKTLSWVYLGLLNVNNKLCLWWKIFDSKQLCILKAIITNLSTIRCWFVNCCTVMLTFLNKFCRSLKQFLSLATEQKPLLSSSRMSRVTSNLNTRLLIPATIEEASDSCGGCCFLFKIK